jgi:hypothetical protein
MASTKLYGSVVGDILGGDLRWVDDDIYVMLLTSSYAPDQEAHTFADDLSHEVSGAGYTAGGALLTGRTATHDAPSNTWVFAADDAVWTGCTFTFRYAVVYRKVGSATPEDDNLIAYIDFGSDQSLSAQTFTLEWNVAGVIRLGYL